MNKLVLVFCFFFAVAGLMAQTCMPNPIYQDSSAGVYPLPYNENTMMGGLDTACQNQDYATVVTFVIPETIEFNGLILDLEYIELETTGAVVGLPAGMTYACNPPDCFFEPTDTIGCMTVYGNSGDMPGRYELMLNGTVKTNVVTADLSTLLATIQTGPYYIDLFGENDPNCTTVDVDEALAGYHLSHQPNPVYDLANIRIEAEEANTFSLQVTDMMGRVVENRTVQVSPGVNNVELNTHGLAAGLYFYTLSNQQGQLTRKMLIHPSR